MAFRIRDILVVGVCLKIALVAQLVSAGIAYGQSVEASANRYDVGFRLAVEGRESLLDGASASYVMWDKVEAGQEGKQFVEYCELERFSVFERWVRRRGTVRSGSSEQLDLPTASELDYPSAAEMVIVSRLSPIVAIYDGSKTLRVSRTRRDGDIWRGALVYEPSSAMRIGAFVGSLLFGEQWLSTRLEEWVCVSAVNVLPDLVRITYRNAQASPVDSRYVFDVEPNHGYAVRRHEWHTVSKGAVERTPKMIVIVAKIVEFRGAWFSGFAGVQHLSDAGDASRDNTLTAAYRYAEADVMPSDFRTDAMPREAGSGDGMAVTDSMTGERYFYGSVPDAVRNRLSQPLPQEEPAAPVQSHAPRWWLWITTAVLVAWAISSWRRRKVTS